MINIFEHAEAHLFLKEHIQSLPKKGWGVSRRLALHLRVNTSLISLIVTGRQNLSLEQAHAIAIFFGWNRLETKYFLLMVQYQRAGNSELKHFYLDELGVVRKEALKLSERLSDYKGLSENQRSTFYSTATFSLIRLFCSLADTGKTIDEIQKQFSISFSELRPMIDFLVESGLILEKNHRLFLGHQHTHLEKGSPHLIKHHTNWRLKTIQLSELLNDDDLMFTGPMSMSKADFLKIREEIVQLIQRTVDTMKTSPSEMVICLNIDWIKVLK